MVKNKISYYGPSYFGGEKMPADRFQLIYVSKMLENDRSLADCRIQEESTVYYRVNFPGGVRTFYSSIARLNSDFSYFHEQF